VVEDVRKVIAALPDTLVGKRDAAVILLGFAAALRRSELVALNVEDVDFVDGGLHFTIRRSKVDQEGAGRQVGVAVGSTTDTCPVRAVRAWLHAAQITMGPIFRRIDQHGHIGPNALQPGAVAQVVKRAVVPLGMDPDAFSGHSLRAGLATSAAEAGANELTIMATTGHKSSQMVKRYVRRANLLRSTAASVAGL
jgi:integrase